MTDQTIPADKVRKIIATYRDGASDRGGMILDALKDLLPPPPRPTLAGMTEEEREECRWMQADVRNFDRRMVVTEVRTSSADLIEKDGTRWNADHERVTPRPDLPRMTWPGDTPHKGPKVTFSMPAPTAPALPGRWRLADHKRYGRVIVTNPTPDPSGHVYVVAPATGHLGHDWFFCPAADLTYIDADQEDDQ